MAPPAKRIDCVQKREQPWGLLPFDIGLILVPGPAALQLPNRIDRVEIRLRAATCALERYRKRIRCLDILQTQYRICALERKNAGVDLLIAAQRPELILLAGRWS